MKSSHNIKRTVTGQTYKCTGFDPSVCDYFYNGVINISSSVTPWFETLMAWDIDLLSSQNR